jgi:amino acid adenylation domain-containing protein
MPSPQTSEKRQLLLDRMLREAPGQPAVTIRRRPSGPPAPLSFGQERMWFLDQLAPGNPFYAETAGTRVQAAIDVEILERAVNAVVQRHETLRTHFEMAHDQPVQVVVPSLHVSVPLVDLSDLPPARQAAEVERLTSEQGLQLFDLGRGPLLRFSLLRLGPREHVFLQSIHHIATDAWSGRVFYTELGEFYTAFATGREPRLPELPIQYGDFAEWQRSPDRRGEIDLQVAYWRDQLRELPDTILPYDRPRPRVLTYRGANMVKHVPPHLSASLEAFSRREHVTTYISALSAFAVLLGFYTGQDDVVVGTPVAGRSRLELEPLIGLFLNTLVLRLDLRGDPTFRELLRRVREVAVNAYSNQDVPFDRLVDELRPERDLGRNPLFQVLFQLIKPHSDEKKGSTGRVTADLESVPFERGTAILDLSFHLWDSGSAIGGLIEYSTDLFETATIERLFNHFVGLLRELIAQPDRPLSNFTILGADTRREMLRDWQGEEVAFRSDTTIHGLFRSRAAASPEAVAIIEGDRNTTFSDLDRAANAIAARLGELGVERNGRVAICLDRSSAMVAAMLGTLRAGAAFVPLDPSYPTERLAYVLKDSRATVLITTPAEAERLAPLHAAVMFVDAAAPGDDIAPHDAAVHPLDAAYVMYTSGSTGRPKGVMATHQATLNRFAWMWQTFPFTADEVACQKTAVGFVDAIWEIFGPLLAGVPLLMLPDGAVKDPRSLVGLLARHKVTRLLVVPSLLQILFESRIDLASELPGLRWWFASGERLSGDLAEQFDDLLPDACLINLYGSSEVAGDITYAVRTRDEPPGDVPIGWPIANCRAYVLDRHFRLAPPGVVGDLYVAGPNLARGYLDRPGLTAERFLPDPFSNRPGTRMYFTGDRARQRRDGCIEFLGRLDQQVKLRGFRIELGEVEAVLQEHPGVRQAVATVQADDAGGRLVAYAVADGEMPDVEHLRQFVAARLPAHMVPATLLFVDTLPLLPNGKLDRAALGKLKALGGQPAGIIAPRSDAEAALAPIWQELLNLDQIGMTDNFFGLGGHSLLATRLVSRIRDAIGIELPLPDVFLHPTIAEQALIIEAKLLGEIESMSEEQVRQHALAAEGVGR